MVQSTGVRAAAADNALYALMNTEQFQLLGSRLIKQDNTNDTFNENLLFTKQTWQKSKQYEYNQNNTITEQTKTFEARFKFRHTFGP